MMRQLVIWAAVSSGIMDAGDYADGSEDSFAV